MLVGVVQVTAGPGDQGGAGAAGRGTPRASHADREQVIDVLKVAFVQGRLTKGELDARVSRTFAARTYGELAALTVDLPPGLITVPRPPEAARPPVSKVVAGAVLIIPAPAVVAAAVIAGSDQLGKASVLVVLVYFMAWIVAGRRLLPAGMTSAPEGGSRRARPRAAGRLAASRAARPAMI